MTFVQIIEMRTTRYEEIEALRQEWEAATEGSRTVRRSIVTRDRNDPERHLVLAFFDSYESAMANSALPETGEFAKRMSELVQGEPRFADLDVLEDRA